MIYAEFSWMVDSEKVGEVWRTTRSRNHVTADHAQSEVRGLISGMKEITLYFHDS
jgi:hypothetical protein